MMNAPNHYTESDRNAPRGAQPTALNAASPTAAANPVDQFREHIWVTPFWEDHVEELVDYVPVERIIFGSDWPHTEGVEKPLDFLDSLSSLSAEDTRKVMRDNVAELTATANP